MPDGPRPWVLSRRASPRSPALQTYWYSAATFPHFPLSGEGGAGVSHLRAFLTHGPQRERERKREEFLRMFPHWLTSLAITHPRSASVSPQVPPHGYYDVYGCAPPSSILRLTPSRREDDRLMPRVGFGPGAIRKIASKGRPDLHPPNPVSPNWLVPPSSLTCSEMSLKYPRPLSVAPKHWRRPGIAVCRVAFSSLQNRENSEPVDLKSSPA